MAGRGDEIPCKQGCGKTFTYESWRVKHEVSCKGPISTATEGRIAARSRAVALRVSRPQVREQKRKSDIPAAAISPAAMLEALRAEVAKLQAAIAAIEAIA